MIIKHNTLSFANAAIGTLDTIKARKINDLVLVKGQTVFKFSIANINSELIVNGVLNLKLLNKRTDDLKDLPSNDCKYYDKIILNDIIIFERTEKLSEKFFKFFKKCKC